MVSATPSVAGLYRKMGRIKPPPGFKLDPLCDIGPCWAGGGVAKYLWDSLLEQTMEKNL
jgi:hypothetical protein